MSDDWTRPFEQALRARRGALLAELGRETHAEDGTLSLPSHRDETDAEISEALDAVDMAQTLRDDGELRRIDVALARIANGSYGTCLDCGTDIAPERLRAEPAALRCAACQSRFEKTHAA